MLRFRRFFGLIRVPAVGLLASLVLAAIFALVLSRSTYLEFPRHVFTFKGDPEKEIRRFNSVFFVKREPSWNIWVLEVILPRIHHGRTLNVFLNGIPLGAVGAEGKTARLEFPASFLIEGDNTVEVGSSEEWSFRRLRVKNIYGYSSGAFSAVLFQRHNSYPDAITLTRSFGFWLVFAGVFLITLILNGVSFRKLLHPRPWLRRLRGLRHTIPSLFLGMILLPVFSKYCVWVSLPTVLWLLSGFYAWAMLLDSWEHLEKAIDKMPRPASILISILAGTRRVVRHLGRMENAIPWSLIALFAFLCFVSPGPKERTGDSLEYVAMLVSWAEYLKPFVTEESCSRMEKRLGEGPLPGESAFFRDLKQRFPALLKNGTEMDLSHFWLYSLAAAFFYWPLRLLSLNIAFSFMLLHLVLLVVAYGIIRRKLGPPAYLSLFAMIFFSPLVWFVNRVHLEFLTVVLSILGVALLVAEDFAGSGFVFALASAQNPPFAGLAALVFFFGFIRLKGRLLQRRLGLWLAAGGLVLLQPTYYFLRLGIANPVLATGAARIGEDVFSIKKMLSFIVDPDIGLLVNWPLALPLVLVFVLLALKKKVSLGPRIWLFLLFSVPVLIWSQSRTSNLNHGGTLYVSRYALWFLYVFFLMVWQVGLYLSRVGRSMRRLWLGVGAALGISIAISYWPTRSETYCEPTWASRLVYERWPGIYDPMPEIFTERYRGKEEHLPEDVWAVSNPSGNKILVRKGRMMRFSSARDLPAIETCPALDRVRVYGEARKQFAAQPKRTYIYINGQGGRLKGKSSVDFSNWTRRPNLRPTVIAALNTGRRRAEILSLTWNNGTRMGIALTEDRPHPLFLDRS